MRNRLLVAGAVLSFLAILTGCSGAKVGVTAASPAGAYGEIRGGGGQATFTIEGAAQRPFKLRVFAPTTQSETSTTPTPYRLDVVGNGSWTIEYPACLDAQADIFGEDGGILRSKQLTSHGASCPPPPAPPKTPPPSCPAGSHPSPTEPGVCVRDQVDPPAPGCEAQTYPTFTVTLGTLILTPTTAQVFAITALPAGGTFNPALPYVAARPEFGGDPATFGTTYTVHYGGELNCEASTHAEVVIPAQDAPPPPPVDQCDNIEGVQLTVPSGYIQIGTSCYPTPPPPVDEHGQCFYEVAGPKNKKAQKCIDAGGTYSTHDGSDHCVFAFPGVALDGFNLAPGLSDPDCLRKQDQ